jgi:hypothetical protein
MSSENGGPAFPISLECDMDTGQRFRSGYGGMSLRDYFAAKFAQSAVMQDPQVNAFLSDPTGRNVHDWIAADSYAFADAMLKARQASE